MSAGNIEVDAVNAKVIWRVPNAECQGVARDQCLTREVDFLGVQVKLDLYPQSCQAHSRPVLRLQNPDYANVWLTFKVVWNGKQLLNNNYIERDRYWEHPSNIQAEDFEIDIYCHDANSRHVLRYLAEKQRREESEAKAERLASEVSRFHALMKAGSDQAAERACRLTRSAVKIQAKWRQVSTRRWFLQERSEKVWRTQQIKFQAKTPYDAILACDSLAKFLEEGKIEFLQKEESHFEVATESANRYRIIAVVGLFDKGKTWLLNKLFGVNLPAGKLCTTRGLSFLWIKERRMLLIDSAGVQSTVSYRKQAVDAIHDAMTTESLVFKVISRISHQMIFVVNDLTWFEQKYLEMLHQNYVQCKKQKELIVVHNLRNTSDLKEATELFRGQVMQCYDGEPSHLGGLNFTAYRGEEAPPVHHVGLCYEFSKAGDEFNAKNREHLLQSLELGNRLGTTMALTDILQSEFSALLPKYVNIETTLPEESVVRSAVSEQTISVSFEKLAEGHNGRAGTFNMHVSPKTSRVTTKTRGIVSALGEIIAHNTGFEPLVNIYDKELEDGKGLHRFICIECPGVSEDEIDIISDDVPNGVKVVINKKPSIKEGAVRKVEPIRQTQGVWMQEFSWDQSEGCFKACEDETTLEHGVLTIVLKKAVPKKWRVGKANGRSDGSGQGQAPSPAGSSFTGSSWIKPSELTLEPTAESLLQPTLASTAEPALEMLAGRAAGA